MSDLNGLSSGHQTANSSRSRRAAGKLLNEEDRVHDRGDDVGALESRKAEIESRLLELEARLERVQRLKVGASWNCWPSTIIIIYSKE